MIHILINFITHSGISIFLVTVFTLLGLQKVNFGYMYCMEKLPWNINEESNRKTSRINE